MQPIHSHCITHFLIGFGSILNIAPTSASTTLDAQESIRAAWQDVGNHLYNALSQGKLANASKTEEPV